MKKITVLILFLLTLLPLIGRAEISIAKPANANITKTNGSVIISWENPVNIIYSKTILFRSSFLIEDYFTYEAVDGLCEKIYEGQDETYTDSGLAENLSYYYILFAEDKMGNYSNAVVLEKESDIKNLEITETKVNTLSGATSAVVNEVSFNEAGIIYNYNKPVEIELGSESRRLALFIIVKSPHSLTEKDKNAISYFIDAGTPTTIILGSGERAGVLNSYLSVFNKLPRNVLEWQDVIKIANGRWPNEKNLESEEQAADVFFNAIYERKPNMDNPNDNAAVTVIAYGLRPAQRNMESEKNAINIYRSIFGKSPSEASDWDLVRAIAYSGATR